VLTSSSSGVRSAATGERATGAGDPWLVVVIVCVAQFMVVLDATIVNVALPSIQRGLWRGLDRRGTAAEDPPAPRAQTRGRASGPRCASGGMRAVGTSGGHEHKRTPDHHIRR
jgi:hypothetical protein